MPSDSPYQHPVIPPRTSSTGMADANHQGKPLHAIPEVDRAGNGEGRVPTNSNIRSKHSRRRSSMDGTKYRDGQWSSEKERILMGPYDYMQQNPGKDIRRQLINAFNVWLQVPAESIEIINKVVAMLHAASLL